MKKPVTSLFEALKRMDAVFGKSYKSARAEISKFEDGELKAEWQLYVSDKGEQGHSAIGNTFEEALSKLRSEVYPKKTPPIVDIKVGRRK